MAAKEKRISTVIQVESLKPRAHRYEVADAKLPSNRLVVFPSGSKSWIVRYRIGGRTRKLTLDVGSTDLARARELGTAAFNAVKAGVDPGAEKQEKKRAGSPVTVEALIDKYAVQHLGKLPTNTGNAVYELRSGAEVERILRKELAPFLKRQADGGISETEASTTIGSVAKRGIVIRNRTLANCKALFTFGMGPEVKATSTNPFAGLKLKKADERERVLSEEEFKAIWHAAGIIGQPYTGVVRLLALTAQRLHEIADLRWSEVNFSKKQLELPGSRTKNSHAHTQAVHPGRQEACGEPRP